MTRSAHQGIRRCRPGDATGGAESWASEVGIVGLPNVGKSTLFNALTAAEIAAENYPFCTIDPNVGVVAGARSASLGRDRRDSRARRTSCPTTIEFVDIAGLVKGASKGRRASATSSSPTSARLDAVAHVVRCFESDDVVHVEGRVEPGCGHRSHRPRTGPGRSRHRHPQPAQGRAARPRPGPRKEIALAGPAEAGRRTSRRRHAAARCSDLNIEDRDAAA